MTAFWALRDRDLQIWKGLSMARVNMSDRDQWLEWARRANFRSPNLAGLLNVSQRQLQRYTHRLFGRSPQAWLDESRLTLAATLLRQRRSVKAVCYELGFKQVSHFSREFKLRHGLSPSQYILKNDAEEARRPRGITEGHAG